MLFYKLFRDKNGRKVGFLQGNEACMEGAILGGVRFFGGYPITPSSEIAAIAAEKLPMYGGRFIQMEDELASMASIAGASMTGVKSMTATSGPGFSLKQENLGYAIINEIPCFIVNVQRGGPSTGLPTQVSQGDVMQAKWGTHGDHSIIALAPSSVQEVVEFAIEAINLSEKYRTPVIFLMDETVGHMREKIVLPRQEEVELVERKGATVPPEDFRVFDTRFGDVPPFEAFGSGYRYNITGLIHDEKGFPTTKPDEVLALRNRLRRKIEDNVEDISRMKEMKMDDADILLISYGASIRSCVSAMEMGRKEGLKIGVLQLITVWPLHEEKIKTVLDEFEDVFVVEVNQGQMVREVDRLNKQGANVSGINKYDGQFITPYEILDEIKEKID